MVTLEPKRHDVPRIRKALRVYMVTSIVTGVMLLMLCAVMVMKYAFGVELFINTPHGAWHFYPTVPLGHEEEYIREGFNLFKAILIAHGWFYVVYLISNFMLWSPMRWPFWRFLVLASGGIVPLLSFFLEGRTAKRVNETLAQLESAAPAIHTTEETIA